MTTERRQPTEKSLQSVRVELASRLRGRLVEIQRNILTQVVHALEPVVEDPTYAEGVRRALDEMLGSALGCIERGGQGHRSAPLHAARQARREARVGVRLDTVLRRYAASTNVLEEFIVRESDGIPSEWLCRILGDLGAHLDASLKAVAAEYHEEMEQAVRPRGREVSDRVLKLLSGDDLMCAAAVDYDFDAWHVGLILVGKRAEVAGRLLAERTGSRALHVPRENEVVWSWLGDARRPEVTALVNLLGVHLPADISVALGEPRQGIEGWRMTHREARVGVQVLLRQPKRFVRGRDAVLLASILQDETLVRSLLESYLSPLDDGRSGQILRETLRAYFSAGGNAAAAAAGLGVTRHTVQRRIRIVEEKIERPIHACNAELQVALQLDEFGEDRLYQQVGTD